jgi:hypothetical protein
MIIVDFNQVMISNLMMQLGNHTNTPLEEGLLRHMVINSLRSYKQKFGDEYGEMIIACDDKNYWRKQIFPYYKANRKKARDSSELDWSLIFDVFNKIKSEIKEYFPYRVVQVEHAEADDIIATLSVYLTGKVLILSGDKDFVQLQKHLWIRQYDPIRKKWITCDDPEKYLFNHILKGDAGDGIPNILSDDDTFVTEKRQRPLTQKRIDAIYNDGIFMLDSAADKNYRRNRDLVDLSCVPKHITESILSKYDEEEGKGRDKLFNYFIKYKLKHMMENIGEF